MCVRLRACVFVCPPKGSRTNNKKKKESGLDHIFGTLIYCVRKKEGISTQEAAAAVTFNHLFMHEYFCMRVCISISTYVKCELSRTWEMSMVVVVCCCSIQLNFLYMFCVNIISPDKMFCGMVPHMSVAAAAAARSLTCVCGRAGLYVGCCCSKIILVVVVTAKEKVHVLSHDRQAGRQGIHSAGSLVWFNWARCVVRCGKRNNANDTMMAWSMEPFLFCWCFIMIFYATTHHQFWFETKPLTHFFMCLLFEATFGGVGKFSKLNS